MIMVVIKLDRLMEMTDMLYRIDFSRLPREVDEIYRAKAAKDFLQGIVGEGSRAGKVIESFGGNLPDGHILDCEIIEDDPGLSGRDVLKRNVISKYPEAKLQSWDEIGRSL
jgi:hypothetical protein